MRSGDARLVELLLDAGADGRYVTSAGDTVFDALPGSGEERDRLQCYDVGVNSFLALVSIAALFGTAEKAQAQKKKQPNPAYAPVVDQRQHPKRPLFSAAVVGDILIPGKARQF